MKYNLISLKIKKYRQILEITQEELAKELNVALGTIKFYESGTRVPSLKMKQQMCDIFKVTLEELEGKSEKIELKERITTILDNYKITNEEHENIIELVCNFFEKCYILNNSSESISNETLELFIMKGGKKSPEEIKVNRTLLEELKKQNISISILDITETIINSIIEFFYSYIMHNKYKQVIFKGITLEYGSHILLKLCIFNKELITQVLKETTINSDTTKYLAPVILNLNDTLEKTLKNCTSFIELPNSMKKDNIKHIAIKINNDEMSFKYEQGNIIILELQNYFKDSQDVLVSINKQTPIIRRIIKNDNGIILQPLNSNYYPKSFSKTELNNGTVVVLGVVVQVLINNDI